METEESKKRCNDYPHHNHCISLRYIESTETHSESEKQPHPHSRTHSRSSGIIIPNAVHAVRWSSCTYGRSPQWHFKLNQISKPQLKLIKQVHDSNHPARQNRPLHFLSKRKSLTRDQTSIGQNMHIN